MGGQISLSAETLGQLARYFSPAVLNERLSVASYTLLEHLGERNSPVCTAAQLRAEVPLSRFDIDWGLSVYELQGIITIRRNIVDWDQNEIRLTDSGRQVADSIRNKRLPHLDEQVDVLLDDFMVAMEIPESSAQATKKSVLEYFRTAARSELWATNTKEEPEEESDEAESDTEAKISRYGRRITGERRWTDLAYGLRLQSFASWLQETMESGVGLADSFRDIEHVYIWLDTNFVVSLLSPRDGWHGISRALLKTLSHLRKESGVKFELLIANETLNELQGMIAFVINHIGGLAEGVEQKDGTHDTPGIALTAEYFERKDIPSPHAFGNEILLRLQSQIKIHEINRQTDDFPVPLTEELRQRPIDLLNRHFPAGRDRLRRRRAHHDLTLLSLARRCSRPNVASWIWTFDASMPALEKMAFGKNVCAISNLYVATVLEALDYLVGERSAEGAAADLLEFAQRYYGAVLGAASYTESLAVATERRVSELHTLDENLQADNTWAALTQIVQRGEGEFGLEAAREAMKRQRRLIDAVASETSRDSDRPRTSR